MQDAEFNAACNALAEAGKIPWPEFQSDDYAVPTRLIWHRITDNEWAWVFQFQNGAGAWALGWKPCSNYQAACIWERHLREWLASRGYSIAPRFGLERKYVAYSAHGHPIRHLPLTDKYDTHCLEYTLWDSWQDALLAAVKAVLGEQE